MSEQSNGFSWFLAGIGIGALVGVLYAPKSGRETREELLTGAREGTEYVKERSRQAADQVNQYVDRSKETVGQYVDRSKEAVNQYVDRSKEYVDKGRSQWSEFVNQGRQFVNDQSGKVNAAVEAGKQAYQTAAGNTTTESEPTEGQA